MLDGKIIVFTGTLSVTRNKAKAMAINAGATVSDAVSSRTDYLVCGIGGGSKATKAIYFDVQVIREYDFILLCSGSREIKRGNYGKFTPSPPKKIEKNMLRPIKKVETRAPVSFPELDLD